MAKVKNNNNKEQEQESTSMQNNNLSTFNAGLHTDLPPLYQFKGTQRFALNLINEQTVSGNGSFTKTNEPSNELYVNLPAGYIPIGKVYIENNDTLIFSVSEDNSFSEIGIMNDFGKYITLVNTPVLNFRVENQIQATYRLRRGCERNIYWTDNFNPPRVINIDDLGLYKDADLNWSADKFNLIKIAKQIPSFESIAVLEGGGSLPPGSYTVAVQYVDENYNGTDWLNETNPIIIYNALLSDQYPEIAGSFYSYTPMNNGDNPLSLGVTSKAIRVILSNLDTNNFPFYRLAFSIADSGGGMPTKTVVSEAISVVNNIYTFSALSNMTEMTTEELMFEKAFINRAKTIEQHENLLLLGNTKSWEGNLCRLQKYASKIKTDCIIRQSSAVSIRDSGNVKSPLLNVADVAGDTEDLDIDVGVGAGYMPGEVYSFGIVYVFKSGFISPVFHIPGRSKTVNGTYSRVEDSDGKVITFPMNTDNNSCKTTIYPKIGTGNCENSIYWGYDCDGNLLDGTQIRHHQFPERATINKPLIKVLDTHQNSSTWIQRTLLVTIDRRWLEETYPAISVITVTYNVVDGNNNIVAEDREVTIPFTTEDMYAGTMTVTDGQTLRHLDNDGNSNIVITKVEISAINSTNIEFISDPTGLIWNQSDANGTITLKVLPQRTIEDTSIKEDIVVNKLGLHFSGIELPRGIDIGVKDDDVVGYYIVRNERTEENKIIYDSGVMTPCMSASSESRVLGFDTYIAPTLLMPQLEKVTRYVPDKSGKIDTDTTIIDNRFWNLITPRHKFRGEKLSLGTHTIQQQGKFNRTFPDDVNKSDQYSRTRYSDVTNGSSYAENGGDSNNKFSHQNLDSGNTGGSPHKKGEDGWCFKMAFRDNKLEMKPAYNWSIKPEDQNTIYVLRGMEYETARNIPGNRCIYNNQVDQVNQIVQIKEGTGGPVYNGNDIPYVVIKKEVYEPYSTFFTLPYYKEVTNLQSESNCEVFNGDAYVGSLRYNTTIKVQNRGVKLLPKAQFWGPLAYIAAGVIIAIGVVLAIFTGGTSAAAGIGLGMAIIAGAGVGLVATAGAIWLLTSMLSDQKWIDNYNKAYNDGLQKTVMDDWIYSEFQPMVTNSWWSFFHSPSDDQMEYATDCLTDLWFESEVNIALKVRGGINGFLGSPGIIESGNNQAELVQWRTDTGGKGIADILKPDKSFQWLMTRDVGSPTDPVGSYRQPKTKLESFGNSKCLFPNPNRNHNVEFNGTVLGELYAINPDMERRHGVKTYFHLPITYNCCSLCAENFPHRFHWSEQSFQEEVVDNYSIFKQNNYRDLDGETGEIMNIFKIRNQLFIHTREALWEVPKNNQERVTDQIVSFIGTGSLYDIPPRKIVEASSGMSAGIWHRESVLLIEHGYFFVCEKQRKAFLFTGQQLIDISDTGMSTWFKDNVPIQMSREYEKNTGRKYPFDDNPSNKYGCGFISTYDSYKDRILLTKKDFKFSEEVTDNTDFELCVRNGQLIIFRNFEQTLNEVQNAVIPETDFSEYLQEEVRPASGWRYIGIEDCKLKFERDIKRTRIETRWTQNSLPNDTNIIVHLDWSSSFNSNDLLVIKDAVKQWYATFAQGIFWTGHLYFYQDSSSCDSQRTWNTIQRVKDNLGLFTMVNIDGTESVVESYNFSGKNILVYSFINENTCGQCGMTHTYHATYLSNPISYQEEDPLFLRCLANHRDDYNTFISDYNEIVDSGGSFKGLLYPIIKNSDDNWAKAYIQYCFKILQYTWTEEEFDAYPVNNIMSSTDWNILRDSILDSANIYEVPDTLPAKDYGWDLISDSHRVNGIVINPSQFQNDINAFIQNSYISVETQVAVDYLDADLMYIDGEEVENAIQYLNSWTLSFDVELKSWLSFHSYLPSMYIHLADKFYSWIYGQCGIWKHNKKGEYQTFYDRLYPFIVEFVSVSNPLITRIWDSIQMICNAQKYNEDTKEYVDVDDIFFNKLIVYNSRQCTGELNIKVKNKDLSSSYLMNQVGNRNLNEIIADKNEKTWSLNTLRDIRIDYSQPIFKSDITSVQETYFIDKILNMDSMNFEKIWTELESFRDKYLEIRFIFDNFADYRLSLDFSSEDEKISVR